MSCRRYGSKPTIAFWMLVAIVDSAMLVATAGPVVMLALLGGLALVAVGVVVARLQVRSAPSPLVTQRGVPRTEPVVRRRA